MTSKKLAFTRACATRFGSPTTANVERAEVLKGPKGWHAPGASHLDLLHAVAGGRLVDAAYAEALREQYLWHEFGDSCLLLP